MNLVSKLKSNFISGLLIILPLIVSLLIIRFMAGYVFILVDPIVRGTNLVNYTGNIRIVAQSIAVFLVMMIITSVGYISNLGRTGSVSKKIISLLDHIPVFGRLYSTVNQISSSFRGENSKFKELVLVEFPREGIYSLGLITTDAPEKVEKSTDTEDMKTVYIPHSPNPTIGNLTMVPEEDCLKLDMSIQKGMKLLLTTGIAYDEDELPEEIKEKTEP